eukprot:11776895-Ditylum_brightwellii.AAC.1
MGEMKNKSEQDGDDNGSMSDEPSTPEIPEVHATNNHTDFEPDGAKATKAMYLGSREKGFISKEQKFQSLKGRWLRTKKQKEQSIL